ncbi:MAG TPA: hypothetical protein VN878_05890 [Usitatibacter sp.]|nr:hypothetical protein [Usitatibacter sp.]
MNYNEGRQAGSVLANRADAPAQLLPVPSAQQQLESAVQALHEQITSLAERLQPILMPPTAPEKEPGKIAQADITVAQKIEGAARGVGSAISRLNELRARLEI